MSELKENNCSVAFRKKLHKRQNIPTISNKFGKNPSYSLEEIGFNSIFQVHHSSPCNSNLLLSKYLLFQRQPSEPKIAPLTQCQIVLLHWSETTKYPLTRVNIPVLGHKSEIILSVLGYCIYLNFSMVNQWTILDNLIICSE